MLNGIHPKVQIVIHEFDELFRVPDEPPPSKEFDHAISLCMRQYQPTTDPVGTLFSRRMKLKNKWLICCRQE
jgi:hypothetical protein